MQTLFRRKSAEDSNLLPKNTANRAESSDNRIRDQEIPDSGFRSLPGLAFSAWRRMPRVVPAAADLPGDLIRSQQSDAGSIDRPLFCNHRCAPGVASDSLPSHRGNLRIDRARVIYARGPCQQDYDAARATPFLV
jgi:hypothetical protein